MTRNQIYVGSAVVIIILLFAFRKRIGRFFSGNESSPPAEEPTNPLIGKTVRITDMGGMPAGKLDASGCLTQIVPLVVVASGTERKVLETKAIPALSCQNPNPVTLVRTSDGWFSLQNKNSVQIIN